MSLWIRQRFKTGKYLWLIDTHPILLLILAGAAVVSLAPHPSLCAKISLILISLGVVCLAVAKYSLFSRGIWNSFGPGGMTKRNSRVYIAAYTLMGSGTILLVLARLITR